MIIEKEELLQIQGGAKKGWLYSLLFGAGGIVVLITGIIDGYLNPNKCHN